MKNLVLMSFCFFVFMIFGCGFSERSLKVSVLRENAEQIRIMKAEIGYRWRDAEIRERELKLELKKSQERISGLEKDILAIVAHWNSQAELNRGSLVVVGMMIEEIKRLFKNQGKIVKDIDRTHPRNRLKRKMENQKYLKLKKVPAPKRMLPPLPEIKREEVKELNI